MKYLQLKMNSHLAIPVKLLFKQDLKEVGLVKDIFDNDVAKVKCQMLNADGYKTAPNKEGKRFDILNGDEFEFTMSVVLFKKCLEHYNDVKQVFQVEMMKNEIGRVEYIVNTDENISDVTVVPETIEPKEFVHVNEDDKWDKINRKKREEIAHGQAYNIATMTVNGANPNLFFTDKIDWLKKVDEVVETIKPKLLEDGKKTNDDDGDDLPF